VATKNVGQQICSTSLFCWSEIRDGQKSGSVISISDPLHCFLLRDPILDPNLHPTESSPLRKGHAPVQWGRRQYDWLSQRPPARPHSWSDWSDQQVQGSYQVRWFFVCNSVSDPIPQTKFRHDKTNLQEKKKWFKISCFDVLNVLESCHWSCFKSLIQCCGSASFHVEPFPFWFRSRPGSGLASKRSRSTCGSCPKFYTCWKIGENLPFFTAMPFYVFPFSVAQVSMTLSILDTGQHIKIFRKK